MYYADFKNLYDHVVFSNIVLLFLTISVLLLVGLLSFLLQYIIGIHYITLHRWKRMKYVQHGNRSVIKRSLCTKDTICWKFYVQRSLEEKFYVQSTAVGEIICTTVILCTKREKGVELEKYKGGMLQAVFMKPFLRVCTPSILLIHCAPLSLAIL